jgi:hypothetical protein
VERVAVRAGPVADRMARRIVPGLYVMVGWYAVVGVVAGGLAGVLMRGGAGAASWWVVPAALLPIMPALGDAASRWMERRRDVVLRRAVGARGRELEARVRAAREAVAVGSGAPAGPR